MRTGMPVARLYRLSYVLYVAGSRLSQDFRKWNILRPKATRGWLYKTSPSAQLEGASCAPSFLPFKKSEVTRTGKTYTAALTN